MYAADSAWPEISKNLFETFVGSIKEGRQNHLISHLAGWQAYFSSDAERQNKTLQHQWHFAQLLCKCAKIAANSGAPAPIQNEIDYAIRAIGEVGIADSDKAWAMNCVRLLRSQAVPVTRTSTVTVPVALPGNQSSGCLASLSLEILDPGTGQVFQHPEFTQLTFAADDFITSLRNAWNVARRSLSPEDLLRLRDLRWRLVGETGDIEEVEGSSASAAAALGILLGLRGQLPDQGLIVLGECLEDGNLKSVARLDDKAKLIAASPVFDTVVVPDSASKATVRQSLPKDSAIQILIAPDLTSLISCRSQLVSEIIDYCNKVIVELNHIPWQRKDAETDVAKLGVPMRVLKENTRLEKIESRENQDERSTDRIDPERAKLYEMYAAQKSQEEVPWSQERLQLRRAIILAGPGAGKSFLTQVTAVELARSVLGSLDQRRARLETLMIPMHCTLSALADSKLPADPADALKDLWRVKYKTSPHLEKWLAGRLSTPQAWLLLDSLDEVSGDRTALVDKLKAISTQGWLAHILLTCRPTNYKREDIPWADLTEYGLAQLNPGEVRQIIQKWFSKNNPLAVSLTQAVDRSYCLSHAARTPLIATFLCLAHEESRVNSTTRRCDLYERVLIGLARRAWKPGQSLDSDDPHVDDLICYLTEIARPLFAKRPTANLFKHSEIMGTLKNTPTWPPQIVDGEEEPGTPHSVRKELLDTGILVNAGRSKDNELQFSFAHRSILEYLVARHLAAEIKANGWETVEPFIDKKSWHPAWQEVVVFLSGLMDDPVPLLALLANEKTDDYTRQRLCLAGHCLPELSDSGRKLYHEAAGIEEPPPLSKIADDSGRKGQMPLRGLSET